MPLVIWATRGFVFNVCLQCFLQYIAKYCKHHLIKVSVSATKVAGFLFFFSNGFALSQKGGCPVRILSHANHGTLVMLCTMIEVEGCFTCLDVRCNKSATLMLLHNTFAMQIVNTLSSFLL